jgi:TonB family protein
MVRALPFHHWVASHLFERLRPGIAISIAVHAGLILSLAYWLSFAPKYQTKDDDPGIKFDLTPKPPPPVQIREQIKSDFHVKEIKPLRGVDVHVDILRVPPVQDFDKETTKTVAITEPAPPVIKDPQPLYRGGLIFPDKAAERNQSGYVDFTFIIEPDGSVGDPVVVAEVPEGLGFAAAARKAFPTWKFAPKYVDGRPVAAPAQIRIKFELK